MWIFTGLFERLISFMDFENAAVALIDENQKGAAHELLDECCTVYEKIIKHYKEDFNCDIIYFHDDWGSQTSTFFSVNTCIEMIVPHLKRIVDYTHSLDMIFEMHSCGYNETLIPCYLEAGVDIWCPQEQNDHDRIIEVVDGKMMIGVWDTVTADLSDAEKYVAGKVFAEKYCENYSQHPVYNCNLWDVEELFKKASYIESRKIFCSQGN